MRRIALLLALVVGVARLAAGQTTPVSSNVRVPVITSHVVNGVPVLMPDGTAGVPSLSFSGESTFGFWRIAAGDLGLADSTTAAKLRIYNTVDATNANYERAVLGWAGNVFIIGTQNAGTGSARAMNFQTGGTNAWSIDTSGNLADLGSHTFTVGGKLTSYNAITTAGQGVPAIYGENISSTQTANFTALSYTPPATAGRYVVSAVITTTSATNTGTVQATVDYVDSQGTTHTADVIPLVDAAGALAATKTGASKEFHTLEWKITINNAATAIVIKVVITGAVSYTVSPSIKQEA